MDDKINAAELLEEARREQHLIYHKDPKTKIATVTINRPDRLNAVSSGMRRLFAEIVQKANIDDDVKVLVLRSEGRDFGTGADLGELENQFGVKDVSLLYEFGIDDDSITYPPAKSNRYLGQMADFFSSAQSGMRPLQEFKKISIVEVKGYCYGWHFYQAADADLLISSDEALFGHASFRYAGWGPRLWTWIEQMGLRKFSEMLFTGRPFTADQMDKLGFTNSVVPRDQLEEETAKFARACSLSRPTDTVVVQKTFMEIYKQYRGELMGAKLTGMVESMTRHMQPDGAGDFDVDLDALDAGLNNMVKDIDMLYPSDFRLSRGNRQKP